MFLSHSDDFPTPQRWIVLCPVRQKKRRRTITALEGHQDGHQDEKQNSNRDKIAIALACHTPLEINEQSKVDDFQPRIKLFGREEADFVPRCASARRAKLDRRDSGFRHTSCTLKSMAERKGGEGRI